MTSLSQYYGNCDSMTAFKWNIFNFVPITFIQPWEGFVVSLSVEKTQKYFFKSWHEAKLKLENLHRNALPIVCV